MRSQRFNTTFLMCRSKILSYYPSKVFLVLDQYSQDLNNIHLRVKQRTNIVTMFNNDSVMNCNTKIPSVANILKNVYLSGTLLNEFTSTYYDDKNDSFEIFSTIHS